MFDTLERVELAADLTPESLRSTLNDVLAELGDRVAPTSLARERLVPVHESLRPLFPDGGLVRGRVHACSGSGGTTMAMAMARDAVVSGAWMAVVDVDTFGVDAASELGVALERVVRVDTGGDGHTADDADAVDRADPAVDPGRRWLEVMAAAVDGFDIVLATVPTAWRTPEGARRASGGLRSLVARLQQRGSVVILTGPTGSGLPSSTSSGDASGGQRSGVTPTSHSRRISNSHPRPKNGSRSCRPSIPSAPGFSWRATILISGAPVTC